jgi:mRNA-degrading endonuclease RelE of RelBE toxin-antitoxin system
MAPVRVLLTSQGRSDFESLPVTVQQRVIEIFRRLEAWPNVSGAKPLGGEWSGCSRIRTGDWRVIFRPFTLATTPRPHPAANAASTASAINARTTLLFALLILS